ncbi:hypothetical protein N806_30595 [Rhodococcus sp. P27]|nr:hypothetical protein G418_18655 [Rhodococcus qingshengii BKS 20-40]ERB55473.1 hypothetical protein N806_30595 [Rhodococcus sp. P27]
MTDLAGMLAGPGQVVTSEDRARISIVVDRDWRAQAVAELIAQCGLGAEVTRSEEGSPLVRTQSTPALLPLSVQWTKGAVKAVPVGWVPNSRQLRVWAVAAGRLEEGGERFVFGLDPHAKETHAPLAQALMRVGIAPTQLGNRTPGPGLRVSGKKRLTKLVEYLGEAPKHVDTSVAWPHV